MSLSRPRLTGLLSPTAGLRPLGRGAGQPAAAPPGGQAGRTGRAQLPEATAPSLPRAPGSLLRAGPASGGADPATGTLARLHPTDLFPPEECCLRGEEKPTGGHRPCGDKDGASRAKRHQGRRERATWTTGPGAGLEPGGGDAPEGTCPFFPERVCGSALPRSSSPFPPGSPPALPRRPLTPPPSQTCHPQHGGPPLSHPHLRKVPEPRS